VTTKPILPAPSRATGYTVSAADYDNDVLQNGAYVQEVLSGANADKIPTSAIVASPNFSGGVLSSGATGILLAADRLAPFATNFGLYRSGLHCYVYTNDGGNLWDIDPITGQIAQPAWTAAPAPLNSYTANVAVAYRKTLPNSDVVWRGSLNMVAASVNAVAFNIPVGFRPVLTGTSGAYFPVPVLTSGAWAGAVAYIAANGDLSINCGTGTTLVGLDGLRYPTV